MFAPPFDAMARARQMVHDHVRSELARYLEAYGRAGDGAIDAPVMVVEMAKVATEAAELAFASVAFGQDHLTKHLETVAGLGRFQKLCAAMVMHEGGEVEVPVAIMRKVDAEASSWIIAAEPSPTEGMQRIFLVPLAEGTTPEEAQSQMQRYQEDAEDRLRNEGFLLPGDDDEARCE